MILHEYTWRWLAIPKHGVFKFETNLWTQWYIQHKTLILQLSKYHVLCDNTETWTIVYSQQDAKHKNNL
jgi:hypothetical protein